MERLFNLDPQLIHDSILLAINVFVLFTLLSFILFEPVRKILKDRKEGIEREGKEAAKALEDAEKYKAEYDQKLKDADKDASVILSDARKKASENESRIISEAKEEALRINEHAKKEAQLEKERVKDDVKTEMVKLASIMATKVAASSISDEEKDKILNKTLEELGEDTWLN